MYMNENNMFMNENNMYMHEITCIYMNEITGI